MVDFVVRFASELASVFYEGSLYILVGFVIAGALAVLIPPRLIARHLGGDNFRSVALAAMFGAPLPLCSCGVLPAAAGLRRSGASRSATLSFLISTPETGVDSIALSYGLLGPLMAVVRPLAAVVSGMIAGLLSTRIRDVDQGDPALEVALEQLGTHEHGEGDVCAPGEHRPVAERRIGERVRRIFHYAFVTLVDEIGISMIVGFLLTGLISAAIPADFFSSVLGWEQGLVPMLAMAAVGVPLYLCASASTPVAAALIAKGLSPGAALVFLLSGPGASMVSITVIGRMLGRRRLKIYVGSIVLVSLAAGLLLDMLAGDAVRAAVQAASERVDSPQRAGLKTAAAVIFLAILVASLVRTGFRDPLRVLKARTRTLAGDATPLGWRDVFSAPFLAGVAVVLAISLTDSATLIVEPGERGIVRRFGRVTSADLEPGLHFHLPAPFGRGEAVEVDRIRDVPIGFRGNAAGRRVGNDEMSFYLTADENIIDVRSVLHYRVTDPVAYALGVGEVEETLRAVARGMLIDLIASRPIDALYTTERRATEVAAAEAVARTVGGMGLGIAVVDLRLLDVHAPGEVHDAFRDVASAIEDKEREIRDADGYAAEQAATASGMTAEVGEQAAAAAFAARSDAASKAVAFRALADANGEAPYVTQVRLYLETVERSLAKAKKLVGSASASGGDVDVWIGAQQRVPALPAPEPVPSAPEIEPDIEEDAR
jgi:HflK protein